jgi:hypothetical protein
MTTRHALLACCLGCLLALAACADKSPEPARQLPVSPLSSLETGDAVRTLDPLEALDLCKADCDKRLSEATQAREEALLALTAEKDAELAKLRDELAAAHDKLNQSEAKARKSRGELEGIVNRLVPADYRTRVKDLQALQKALGKYQQKFGEYPLSPQWGGLYSLWGPSSEDWVPGLAPGYIPVLPRDPRQSSNPEEQYIYRSDGTEYKLLAHKPGDCQTAKVLNPELIDPVRDCDALGIWTPGARDW